MSEDVAADSTRPSPPARLRRARRWTGRHRHATAFLLLIAATLALRLGWGWNVSRQLAAEEAAIRARGEPLTPAEMVYEPVPPEEDALPLYVQAAAVDTEESPASGTNIYPDYPPYGPEWETAAATSEKNNRKVLDLARQARARARAAFRTQPPTIKTLWFSWTPLRQVANTVGDGAVYSHLKGDHLEAIERLFDGYHLAEITRQDDTLIGQLVGIGIENLFSVRCQVIAPGLDAADPSVRSRILQLIDVLSNEQTGQRQLITGVKSERAIASDWAQMMGGKTWVLRPDVDQTLAENYRATSVLAAAAREQNAAAARRAFAPLGLEGPIDGPLISDGDAAPSALQNFLHFVAQPINSEVPDFEDWMSVGYDAGQGFRRIIEQHYRQLASRRVTRVSLAIQLYRADHGGRVPLTLGELVPDYLPAVPADPFYDDGRPVGYQIVDNALPDGGDRPLVTYDPGSTTDNPPDAEPMFGWHNDFRRGRQGAVVRQYLDVVRWTPQVRRYDEEKRRLAEEAAAEEAATEAGCCGCCE